MKISLKWINEYIDVTDYFEKPQALADILTKAGLEVEEITDKAKALQHVVTGLILEKDKHPNSDKLSLCKVTTGEGVVHQIVCGAQNHKSGDKVIVALPGAVLPGNFEIKQATVRGVDSGGMLCSWSELGLEAPANTPDGIVILSENAPIGKALTDYLGLDDITFELKVTPNRADCLSHYGLARELAALISKEVKKIDPQLQVGDASTKSKISLDVKEPSLCQRYCGRFIAGVKVGPSPAWLKQRLENVGLNSINNVVDVTNYVMLELGQPLHAFDVREIRGGKIVVEKSKAGEKFQTLDATEITLSGHELMIKDGERSVALAGVVGGKNSGIQDDTTDVFVESAYFAPEAVRKTMRSFGIQTDSGYRFSRGVDPDGAKRAMDRACELIQKVAGGEIFADNHDFYPNPVKKNAISIQAQLITDRLGYECDSSKLKNYLQRLSCEVVDAPEEGGYRVTPPTFRVDIETQMDLVEEYARLNGYEHIPENVLSFAGIPTAHDKDYLSQTKTVHFLAGQNYRQAVNSVFESAQKVNQFSHNAEAFSHCGLRWGAHVPLKNPLNEEMNTLRRGLAFTLWKNVLTNFHQGNEFGRLFEVGKVLRSEAIHETRYQEEFRVGLVAWGETQNMWQKNNLPLFFELKSVIEKLAHAHHKKIRFVSLSDKGQIPSYLHKGNYSIIELDGKACGYIGSIHPVLLEDEKVRVPVVVAELEAQSLWSATESLGRTKTPPRFPKVERDLAFVLPKTTRVGEVCEAMMNSKVPHLTKVSVFDVFEGEALGARHKSVAFRLTFQNPIATLQDAAVNEAVEKLKTLAQTQFEAALR